MLFFAIMMMCIQVSIEADCRSVIFENDLVPLSELKTLGDEFIHVLMIATLEENNSSSLSLKILDQLSQLFKSIITNSLGTPLHVIIVSDVNSIRQIRLSIENVIGKHLSELLIMNYYRKDYEFPKLRIEFASLKDLLVKNRDRVDMEDKNTLWRNFK